MDIETMAATIAIIKKMPNTAANSYRYHKENAEHRSKQRSKSRRSCRQSRTIRAKNIFAK